MLPESSQNTQDAPVLILIPVFNDWEAALVLLTHLDGALHSQMIVANVLFVDDASNMMLPADFGLPQLKSIAKVAVLELRRNFGHQRAIALGLAYAEGNLKCRAVVVMDGDGEDAPNDVPRLIEKCAEEGYSKMIFGQRSKRAENLAFRAFYVLYRSLYKILTGHRMRVGNFSVIPYSVLRRLVAVSEVWNHFAAGALKAKIPYSEIPTRRGKRLVARPQMNFVSLVTHGLSAISVHGEVVGVRLLIATSLLIIFAVVGMGAAITIKLTTTLAIPGWATYVVALSFIVLIQAVILSLFFIFVILSGRNNSGFLPLRDYHHFISRIWTIPSQT